MAARIFRINYKSDFILTMNSEAGWEIPFCIKFWTSIPSRAYFVGYDGETYTHCAYDPSEPTKLMVQFDDHHLPIGNLHFQISYHFTVDDFPNNTEDEVFNEAALTTEIDGETYQVMLDFNGETAPGIDFSLPSVGVTSVNGKVGVVTLSAEDVGAQPTIEDLATIRSGAAEGATAVQPAEMTAALATKQNVIEDLATIRSGAAAGATAVQPATLQEGLATKQDVISDLSNIRNGAAAGATAVQPAALTPIESALQTIEAVIPSAATAQNQLADKDFVNSSISMNTANFVGTYNSLAELQAVQNPTNNDYGFVIETDAQGNEYYDRYKYVANSQQWLFEYKVESTPFTAAQWAAIQSGITSALVTKLNALPTAQQLSNQLAAKQDTISDLATIRSGAAAGATAYQKPGTGIPNTDLASAVQTSLERADEAALRPYNTQSPDGMGYLVLEKDQTFASQVTTANTIYEIRYDFVLSANFNMPSNCVLKFNGGSVSGAYSLTGANTKIEAGLVKIFGTDTTIGGTWNITESYPEWFGAKGDGVTDDSQAIQSCIDYASVNGGVAFLSGKDYKCNTALNVKAVTLMGCGREATGTMLHFYGTSGIVITGRNTVIENVLIVQATDGSGVGIDFDDGNFGSIPDVFINNVSVTHFEYGLRATKSVSWSNKFDNIRLQFNKNAMYIDTFAGNLNGTHFCNEFNNLLILNVQGGYSLYLRGAMCIFNNANISCVSNYCIWVSSSFVQFNSCSFENDSPVTDNSAMISVGKYVDFVNCRFVHNYTTDGNNYFIYSQTGTDLSIRFINCNEVSYTGSKLTSIVYPGFGASSTYGSVYENGNSFSIYDTVYTNYKPYIQRAGQPISVFSNSVDTSKMKEKTLYDYLDETTQKRHLVYLKNGQLYDFKTNMQVGVISERTPITPLSGTDGGCYYEVFDKHYVHVHVAITDLTNDTTTIVLTLPNSIRVDYAMPIFYSNANGNPSQYTNLYYGVIANGQVVKYKATTMYADIYYFIP